MKTFLYLSLILIFSGCASNDEVYISDYSFTQSSTKSPKINKQLKLTPYKVLGKWYHPKYANVGEVFRGISSWYGPNFHGKLTANGEKYNMYAFTAAHKTLPLGTKIKVTNLNNNKSVIVRINDRGPFVKERILDLSYSAGKKIGIDKTGTAPVEIEVLSVPNFKNSTPKYKISKNYKKSKTFKKKNGKISIQIGAFNHLSGAKIFKQEFDVFNKKTFIKKTDGKYKVFIGTFNTYEEAQNFKNTNQIKGFIVR